MCHRRRGEINVSVRAGSLLGVWWSGEAAAFSH